MRVAIAPWLRMLRPHQWAKNVLIFVPLLAAHQFTDLHAIWHAVLAFASFSLLASAVYIANDIIDIDNDRLHPTKRNRPFAAGTVPVRAGYAAAPVLLIIATLLALVINTHFLIWLAVYLVVTTAYTFGLKKLVLVDAIVLATLYTIRIFAGGRASDTDLSYWIVAFSIFLFLSLAFVKRYAELTSELPAGADDALRTQQLAGRGYRNADAPLIALLGVAAGFSAAVVLALYINSNRSHTMYAEPEILWAVIPVAVYWVSWIWLKTFRGEMHDDPVIFALTDRSSFVAALVFVAIVVAATVGLVP
ncbi:MAG: UbiA family prenyltransferase [Candidatus Nanopelagicales bacterium]